MIPEVFKERMKLMLGNEYAAFTESYRFPASHGLRLNPLKTSIDKITAAFGTALSPIEWCPTGFYYNDTIKPGKHPYHEAGAYYIQEPSAMAPAEYLDIQPDDMVLDLCAAPGGKSTQIAGKLTGSGLLISNEIVPSRAKILSENIERLGIRNAIVTNESPARLTDFFTGFFDKIMVDAPCSGEGMFRKNEAACDEWSLENVTLCAKRQAEILDCAAEMLKSGGRIVYSTCTFSPEEDEETIAHFLSVHSDFQLLRVHKTAGMSDGLTSVTKDCIRLFPHKISGEGHFIAVLQNTTTPSADNRYFKNTVKSVKEKSIAPYFDFSKNFLNTALSGTYLLFGDHLYLVPPLCPKLDRIKVLRAGLHLGTFIKNRFEPSHSLALALCEKEVKNVFRLSLESDEIYRYLSGEALPHTGEKGWYLVTVDGFSTGLGKLSGDLMKNHYPKGLRKNLF